MVYCGKSSWDFSKYKTDERVCRSCDHNEVGVCNINSREIPYTYALQNRRPKWCPKEGKK